MTRFGRAGHGGLALLLVAAASRVPATQAQGAPGTAQSVEAGGRVFRVKGCLGCHAIDGRGGGVGPDLGRLPGRRSFFQLAAALWNHIPQMQREMSARQIERPELTPWEAADLIAFLFWLDYFDEPGDTTRGAALFQRRRCVVCHQVRGLGGVRGPDLGLLVQSRTPIMIAAGMWNHAPAMAAAMREGGVSRPRLTGAELRDLLAYLRGSRPELPAVALYVLPGEAARGRRLFDEKRCAACHRGGEGGGTVGPDLGATRYGSVVDFAAAMWNKGPRMVAAMAERGVGIPELRADEMADLVAYLYAGRYFSGAGDAGRGAQVVRGRCEGCHARGGATATDLTRVRGLDSPAAVVAALWSHVSVPPAAPAGERGRWPALSAADVADVVAHLQRLGGSQ